MGIGADEYPNMVSAYEDADAAGRRAMKAVVDEIRAEGRRDFQFSKKERDDFLVAGGFCAPTPFRSHAACRPVPPGEEGAIDSYQRFASDLVAKTPPRIAR